VAGVYLCGIILCGECCESYVLYSCIYFIPYEWGHCIDLRGHMLIHSYACGTWDKSCWVCLF
jgi:hypothetical protein